MPATKITPAAHEGAYYHEIARLEGKWKRVETKIVPPSGGGAAQMRRGRVARIKLTEGPQVVDFNCWSQADNREHFWSGRTRILEGAHLTAGNRLWSTHPWMRPMITIVNDTVRHAPSPGGGAGHDCIFARCNDKIWEIAGGRRGHANCQDNLAGAVAAFGLTGFDVHDAFNLFMKTGIDPKDGRLFFEKTDGQRGDYVDLYAEIDLVIACSSCPTGAGDAGLADPIVHGFAIEIYDLGGVVLPGEREGHRG
jgi:uncharacterized protein YcgI (DUF1989 family)